ncbi:MAG: DNA (cytosine-5-)-methyltransferase [Spirochaetia bacterium]|nr:DNA (cytosine-5-)-methyltransferase [Spirochaetia bacterium]
MTAACDIARSEVLELLDQVVRLTSVTNVAEELEVAPSTVHRWLKEETSPKGYIEETLRTIIKKHKAPVKNKKSLFTFIDLFAGIGGIRKGFELAGGTCVFTSEWDSWAQKTYSTNYPSCETIHGDITKINAADIPDHDILLAGFPCQPFSIAGVSKKNSLGLATGFADETQGTLFFDVVRIIKEKTPNIFVLENVKNLKSHNKGHTFDVITRILQKDLGYHIDYKVIDGQHWVPQHRERIIIVGFKNPNLFSLENIKIPAAGKIKLRDILHKLDGCEPYLEHDGNRFFDYINNQVQQKYTLTDKLWSYLQAYAAKHRSLGNGFGFGLVNGDDIARTLSARYYKDGSEILVNQGEEKNPRRLTPRECARLMGYPDDYIIPVSDTRAYRQFGNSVVVPLFRTIAQALKPYLTE